MKISVILTSNRAQETIDKVRNILGNVSGMNEVEVIVRTSDTGVAGVLAKYLPQDPRVWLNGDPSGEMAWFTDDLNPGINPRWDESTPLIPLDPPPVEQQPSVITEGSDYGVAPQDFSPIVVDNPVDNSKEEETTEDDDWDIVSTSAIPGSNDVLAVLRKRTP